MGDRYSPSFAVLGRLLRLQSSLRRRSHRAEQTGIVAGFCSGIAERNSLSVDFANWKLGFRRLAAGDLEMENGGEAEMIDDAVSSLSPKVSCLDGIRASDANEVEALKKGSGIGAEKPEDGVDSVSSSTEDVVLSKFVNGKLLGPVTPIPIGESAGLPSFPDQTEDEDLDLGCQTPTDNIFDPFAPGPEELAVAPKKKILRETRIPLRRQLNFESCCNSDDEADHRLLDSVRKSFLDLILSNQLREMSPEKSIAESNPSEGPMTPTCLPFLTGIADVCPAAPMRLTSTKSMRFGDSICRKLDFGGN